MEKLAKIRLFKRSLKNYFFEQEKIKLSFINSIIETNFNSKNNLQLFLENIH